MSLLEPKRLFAICAFLCGSGLIPTMQHATMQARAIQTPQNQAAVVQADSASAELAAAARVR